MSSGLDVILDFSFTKFGFRIWDRICYACFFSVLLYIVSFFSDIVYSVSIILLLGVNFICIVGLNIVGALVWCEGGGVGLTLDSSDFSHVY